MAACPLRVIASGLSAVCSRILPIMVEISSILSNVADILPEVTTVLSKIPPILPQVLTILSTVVIWDATLRVHRSTPEHRHHHRDLEHFPVRHVLSSR